MVAAVAHRQGRVVHDADSHMVEPAGWFENYTTEYVRQNLDKALFPLDMPVLQPILEKAKARVSGEDVEFTEALKSNIFGHPGKLTQWTAYGAYDSAERSQSLDLMGVTKQLVFPGQAITTFIRSKDIEVVYGGADALNRGMVDFCTSNGRLLPVGYVPLNDPDKAIACTKAALASGIKAVWIKSDAYGGRSPAHVDYDPIWAMLEEAKVPVVLHIGSGVRMEEAYMNTGVKRELESSVTNIESTKPHDVPVLHHSIERWLTCMIYHGVLERFPTLMIGLVELGACWIPGCLQNLDMGVSALGRFDKGLQRLSLKPSEYFERQVRATPFHMEDAGWVLRNVSKDILMFNTDYPHPEGGSDPFGSFERSLNAVNPSEEELDHFYGKNFESLMGLRS